MSGSPERGIRKNVRTNYVPEEQAKMLQPEGLDHELVRKLKPKYLAVGGEHAVYEFPEHPDLVAKVDYVSFKHTIKWNLEHGLAADDWSPGLREEQDRWNAGRAARLAELKDYFGKHVLPQRWYTAKVPLPPGLLEAVYERTSYDQEHPDKAPANPTEAWATVSLQRRAESLQNEESKTFVTRTQHVVREELSDLKRVVDIAIAGGELRDKKAEFVKTQSSEIREITSLAETDLSLRHALTDFVTRAIRYANETGNMLDTLGLDNVVFYPKEGIWTYEMVDALDADDKQIEKSRNDINAIAKGLKTPHECGRIAAVDYVVALNGLASLLGIDERIVIAPLGLPSSLHEEQYLVKDI